MIQKHAIPILEFDDNPQAVIMPNHEGLDLQLPKKCIYAFLEEEIDRYAQEVEADCVGEFVSATKTYPVYVINYKGEKVCLVQAPVGSAPAALLALRFPALLIFYLIVTLLLPVPWVEPRVSQTADVLRYEWQKSCQVPEKRNKRYKNFLRSVL